VCVLFCFFLYFYTYSVCVCAVRHKYRELKSAYREQHECLLKSEEEKGVMFGELSNLKEDLKFQTEESSMRLNAANEDFTDRVNDLKDALGRESELALLLENERRSWSGDKHLMRAENKQLEGKVAGLSKRLGEELARAKRLDAKLQSAETKLEVASGLKAEVEVLKEKSRSSHIQNKQLVKDINSSRSKLEETNLENASLSERLQSMESKFLEMKAECKAAREELHNVEDTLRLERESLTNEKATLVEEVAKTKLDVEKVRLDMSSEAFEFTASATRREIGLTTHLEALKKEVEILTKERSELIIEKEDLVAKKAELVGEVESQRTKRAESMTVAAAQHGALAETMSRELEDCRTRLRGAERRVEIEASRARSVLEGERLRHQSEIEKLITKHKKLHEEAITDLKQEHENVLNQTLEEERSGHVSANQAAANASAEAFKAATMIANAETQKHYKEREIKYEEKITNLEKHILFYKESEHNFRKHIEVLEENMNEISNIKNCLEQEKVELEKEIITLKADNKELSLMGVRSPPVMRVEPDQQLPRSTLKFAPPSDNISYDASSTRSGLDDENSGTKGGHHELVGGGSIFTSSSIGSGSGTSHNNRAAVGEGDSKGKPSSVSSVKSKSSSKKKSGDDNQSTGSSRRRGEKAKEKVETMSQDIVPTSESSSVLPSHRETSIEASKKKEERSQSLEENNQKPSTTPLVSFSNEVASPSSQVPVVDSNIVIDDEPAMNDVTSIRSLKQNDHESDDDHSRSSVVHSSLGSVSQHSSFEAAIGELAAQITAAEEQYGTKTMRKMTPREGEYVVDDENHDIQSTHSIGSHSRHLSQRGSFRKEQEDDSDPIPSQDDYYVSGLTDTRRLSIQTKQNETARLDNESAKEEGSVHQTEVKSQARSGHSQGTGSRSSKRHSHDDEHSTHSGHSQGTGSRSSKRHSHDDEHSTHSGHSQGTGSRSSKRHSHDDEHSTHSGHSQGTGSRSSKRHSHDEEHNNRSQGSISKTNDQDTHDSVISSDSESLSSQGNDYAPVFEFKPPRRDRRTGSSREHDTMPDDSDDNGTDESSFDENLFTQTTSAQTNMAVTSQTNMTTNTSETRPATHSRN